MTSPVRIAFVLGAGLGSRLRPLTDRLPKPLLPIYQKPLITFAMDHLIAAGIDQFLINTHHLSEHFYNFFRTGTYRSRPVSIIPEKELLETGGALRQLAGRISDQSLAVYSGDILTDLELGALFAAHRESGNLVTLALRRTRFEPQIAWDAGSGRIVDIGRRLESQQTPTYDFANISIWESSALRRLPERPKFSFIPVLAEWIRQGLPIGGVLAETGSWFNISVRSDYTSIHQHIHQTGWRPDYLNEKWPLYLNPTARVAPGADIDDSSSIGAESVVEENVRLRHVIAWPKTVLRRGTDLTRSIVSGPAIPAGVYSDTDFL